MEVNMKQKFMILLFLMIGMISYQGAITTHAQTMTDDFKYIIGNGNEDGNDNHEKYCTITGYNGTQKDIVIPDEIEGKDRIYIDIDHLEGKNKQVRSIHLSKNVCGIDGEPYPDQDEDIDWSDESIYGYSFYSYHKHPELKKSL